MNIPDAFARRLQRVFDGRLRIRWSVRQREFHVEQRVGNAVLAPIRIEEDRDDLICARDGYAYVLSVRTGDRMPCPQCNWQELKVPIRDFATVRCGYCASKGVPSRVIAGYWPLDDALITHLQKIDPYHNDIFAEVHAADKRNADMLERATNAALSESYAYHAEHYYDMAQVAHVQFSGANKYWPSELGAKFNKPSVSSS